MEGKRFIHSLQLENLLSYGKAEEIELQPLNVLIGSNASGKSNLIEALNILRATPTDLLVPFRQGGGISEFFWKGDKGVPVAKIQVIVEYPNQPLSYRLMFTIVGRRLELIEEEIENEYSSISENNNEFYYRYQSGHPVLKVKSDNLVQQIRRSIVPERLIIDQSILSQRKEPELYPELSYLSHKFSSIGIYREWDVGQQSEIRKPQKTDLVEHPLFEDASNLGLFLNNLQYELGNRQVIDQLKKFYEIAEELNIKVYGGTAQIFIREQGLTQPIPANRLSDGTLRYLFLMALLLDPTPPPLICIEEPEIGLHPDILPTIAEMLIDASQRTQLIVTTHSDALVSAIPPESVLVCERDDKGSHLRRLEPERLKNWLENYTLGDLWRMGEIGGTRW
ncbi:AAA family ATPase [Scytonema sp. NUACC26]|uniref:AAA family ATPase n=1 Tax=Scytonema sp. NUACC26 TaxID=3140176 RepID=UPI0034DC6C40